MFRNSSDPSAPAVADIHAAQPGEDPISDAGQKDLELTEMVLTVNRVAERLKKLTSELDRRTFEMNEIKAFAEAMKKNLTLQELIDLVMEKALKLTGAQIGSLCLVEKENNRLLVVASQGFEKEPKTNFYIDLGQSLIQRVVSEKKPLVVENLQTDPRVKKTNDPKYGSPSFLILPIFEKENIVGVLNLSSKESGAPFTCHDEKILSILVSRIGNALETARLESEIRNYRNDIQKGRRLFEETSVELRKKSIEHDLMLQALRKREEKYRAILESIEEGYFEVDLAGNLTFANEALCRITGFGREELLGMSNKDYTTSESVPKMQKIFNTIYRTQQPVRMVTFEVIRNDGETAVLELSASLMKNEEGRPVGFRGVVRDVSERLIAEAEKKKLEEQLRQAQKMEAIGTLAGGIAHDFNNALQGISGYTQLLLMKNNGNDTVRKYLEAIERSVGRAGDLIRQLMIFSRKVESTLGPVDLNQEVGNAARLLERTLSKTVKIELYLENGLHKIHADSIQLEQILINLGINARDAMPDGGKLIISTQNFTVDAAVHKGYLNMKSGNYVLLSVSDTGCGMPDEVKEHIFEPFFTTKEKGKGTGLGLAMVYGIVKNHDAHISCYSHLDQGTTFKIYFPVPEESKRRGDDKESREAERVFHGSETILLVDDEPVILDIGQEVLRQYGYKILKACSGKEAVELYQAHKNQIDLVILDYNMPEIDGGRCLQELLQVNPTVKVLIASGYALNDQLKKTINAGAAGFIGKPYQLKAMLQQVRSVLDQNPFGAYAN